MSVASEDTGLDEESESCDIKSQSGVSTASSSAYSSGINQSEKGSQNDLETMSEVSNTENDLTIAMAQESEYSNIEIGDIQDDKSEQSSLSNVNTGSQETLLSIKSLSPTHQPDSRLEIIGQDMNGNPEIVEPDISPNAGDVTDGRENILDGIGEPTRGVPLLYCVRVICKRFLLSRKKQELLGDRLVRVSMKCSALGSVACAVKISPSVFLEKLMDDTDDGEHILKSFILNQMDAYCTNILWSVYCNAPSYHKSTFPGMILLTTKDIKKIFIGKKTYIYSILIYPAFQTFCQTDRPSGMLCSFSMNCHGNLINYSIVYTPRG